jgi:hypothetical protein
MYVPNRHSQPPGGKARQPLQLLPLPLLLYRVGPVVSQYTCGGGKLTGGHACASRQADGPRTSSRSSTRALPAPIQATRQEGTAAAAGKPRQQAAGGGGGGAWSHTHTHHQVQRHQVMCVHPRNLALHVCMAGTAATCQPLLHPATSGIHRGRRMLQLCVHAAEAAAARPWLVLPLLLPQHHSHVHPNVALRTFEPLSAKSSDRVQVSAPPTPKPLPWQ